MNGILWLLLAVAVVIVSKKIAKKLWPEDWQ